jgi:hypothetical protein
MIRVCPNPIPWNNVYVRLLSCAPKSSRTPSHPPKPLILNGWIFSNNIEKFERWKETIQWANENSCTQIIDSISDNDYYYVNDLTTHPIGPMDSPMYRTWVYEVKKSPDSTILKEYIDQLILKWDEIAGSVLSPITKPICFTGKKYRRLLIQADKNSKPPWGSWITLSSLESERRTFTMFRKSINQAIKPHEVDHIDFVVEEIAEPTH